MMSCLGGTGSWKSTPRSPLGLQVEQRPSQSNFSTVAIVPVSEDVPLSQFTLELYHSLLSIGKLEEEIQSNSFFIEVKE